MSKIEIVTVKTIKILCKKKNFYDLNGKIYPI